MMPLQIPPRVLEYSKEEKFLIFLEGLMEVLDEEFEVRIYIRRFCGLGDNEELTQKVLEHYLDRIVERLEKFRLKSYYEDDEGSEPSILEWYYILAIIIFETGSAFPSRVKDVIFNNRLSWIEDTFELKDIEYFKQKIRDHISGSPLKEEYSRLWDKLGKDFTVFQKMLNVIFHSS